MLTARNACACIVPTVTVPRRPPRTSATASRADWAPLSSSRAWGSSASPAWVSATWWVLRSNGGLARSSSSRRTAAETADCVVSSRRAAAEKTPSSATARNALSRRRSIALDDSRYRWPPLAAITALHHAGDHAPPSPSRLRRRGLRLRGDDGHLGASHAALRALPAARRVLGADRDPDLCRLRRRRGAQPLPRRPRLGLARAPCRARPRAARRRRQQRDLPGLARPSGPARRACDQRLRGRRDPRAGHRLAPRAGRAPRAAGRDRREP